MSARARLGLLAGGAIVVVLLGAVLVTLRAQLDTAESQNARIGRLVAQSSPVLDDAAPALEDVRKNIGSARRGLRQASVLAEEALPLVRELDEAGLDQAADKLRDLIEALQGDGLAAGLNSASRLLSDVERLDLAPRTGRALEDIRLTARRQGAVLRAQRSALRIQRATFRTQVRALAILRESLGIQRDVLRHARSLDRKLGGTLPEPTTPTP